MWKITLVLNTVENTLNAGDISINSGIFQGDSLCLILFCVTLTPLSKLLNNTGYGYKIYNNTINHLFYMDNLKLYAKNDQQVRVRSILRKELNARNRIDAINSLPPPVVTYSFTIINWSLTEIKKIYTKIRKLLTKHRMHHPKSDVNRLYLPRKEGGRRHTRKINECTLLLAMRKNI